VFLIFRGHNLFAQSGSSYTRFGLGDANYSYSVRRMGMGNLGTSIADVDFISAANPASLYRLGKTRIEFSLNYNGIFLSNSSQKNYFADTDFGGFTVGVPISSDYGIGASFGLVPVSNVSYKVLENHTSSNSLVGDYKIEYLGNGGISKVYFGTSYSLPFDLFIGASFDYLFGNINYNSSVEFISSSSFASEYEKNYRYRGIGGTFGVISPDFAKLLELNSISDFRFGMAFNLFSDLNSDTLYLAKSLVGIDTVSMGSQEVNIPLRFSIGTSFVLNKKYLFSLDYSSQAWSKYSINDIFSSVLQDAYKISLGFEYHPLRELGLTFWEQVILRAGLSYEQTQYFIYGQGINQYSVSLGASLPLSYENSLDIGLIYARRGTTDTSLLKEDIIKLGIGFSLGELWFLRQDK
jgi:hypothetical protein